MVRKANRLDLYILKNGDQNEKMKLIIVKYKIKGSVMEECDLRLFNVQRNTLVEQMKGQINKGNLYIISENRYKTIEDSGQLL